MAEAKKNPALLALAPLAIDGIKSLVSIFQDKKRRKQELGALAVAQAGPAIEAGKEILSELSSTDGPIQLSSKRLMNIVGTGVIVAFALTDMSTHGINGANTIVLALGILYSIAMGAITYLSERK